jgi:hypothetical protein
MELCFSRHSTLNWWGGWLCPTPLLGEGTSAPCSCWARDVPTPVERGHVRAQPRVEGGQVRVQPPVEPRHGRAQPRVGGEHGRAQLLLVRNVPEPNSMLGLDVTAPDPLFSQGRPRAQRHVRPRRVRPHVGSGHDRSWPPVESGLPPRPILY